jgi:hypothetical protein
MFKHAADYTAPVVLTEEQLELISGGYGCFGPEPTPTVTPIPTIVHSGGGGSRGPNCGPDFPGPVFPG